MKTYIYVSGFVSAFLLFGWFMAFLLGMSNHMLMLVAGAIVFFIVYLPLVIIKRKNHKQRMREIIHNYRQQKEENKRNPHPEDEAHTEKSSIIRKGWSMNNSPYRERKSGLTWGGGNIHAANASRGARKRRK